MCGSMSPFRMFFADVIPILMRDPLAEFVGAFEHHRAVLEFSFDEVVKMSGHACPTVAAAFVCCKKALGLLHLGDTPQRGNIAITVHGAPDSRTYGVVGQVFSFVTGACGPTGFKGLGGKFNRKDLLVYQAGSADGDAMRFTFARVDNGKQVAAAILPQNFPTVPGQEQLPELMEKAIRGAASHEEVHAFQDLWMAKVKAIVLEERNVEAWLVLT